MLPAVRGRDLADVFAVVAALGDRERLAGQLPQARLRAEGEVGDLHAGVVVVVLAGDRPPGPFEQRGDGVAEDGLAAVPDVQRTGGVGRHELDVDWPAGAVRPSSEIGARGHHGVHRAGEQVLRQPEIDEPGAGDFGAGDEAGRKLEHSEQLLGHLARVAPVAPRHDHGEVGGDVAVSRVARALQHELGALVAKASGSRGQRVAQRFVHSAAFFAGAGSLAAGLASGFASALAGFVSAAGVSALSAGSLRGPLPSLP